MESFIQPKFISAYIICQGKYLVIRRCGLELNGTWQMVSGGIEPGEKAYETALREIKEETGIIPDRFYSADFVETFYTTLRDKIAFVPVFVAIIDNFCDVMLAPKEHDSFEWLSLEEARTRLVWSEQRRAITHVHENFVLKTPHPLLLIK